MKINLYLCVILLFVSCKSDTSIEKSPEKKSNTLELKYAKGFEVTEYGNYKILKITKAWPNADKSFMYAITNSQNPNIDLKSKTNLFDAVINGPINSLVVTSTTHIPSLELLGVEQCLVGFPGTNYISSEKTRQRIDSNKVRELGTNEGMNTEVLLELNPDVVVGFGVDGVNKSFETLKNVGIPVIYNGDWVEDSALAKAEWIKFFGALFNKEKEADSIFNRIETEYLTAKNIASQATSQPTVLSGAMHKDVWYLPNGQSPEAQILKDANVNYLWQDTSGNGSLALSFETVFEKGKNAQFWLSPSYYSSFEQLEQASTLYSNFEAFKTKSIYTFSNTIGATGGVLYYEVGTARPDLVLKDIIKICHPDLLEDYNPYFFTKLN